MEAFKFLERVSTVDRDDIEIVTLFEATHSIKLALLEFIDQISGLPDFNHVTAFLRDEKAKLSKKHFI